MKKKGFTLIELLAVIVILAIIALIAVPLVLNIIEKARKGAAKSSAVTYVKATETYLVTSELDKTIKEEDRLKKNTEYKVNDILNLIEVKGDKPSGGTIKIGNKNDVESARLIINGYVITYDGKEYKVIGKAENIPATYSSITFAENAATLKMPSTLKLNPTLAPNDVMDGTLVWTSSDTSIATVSKDGVVTGVKKGTVTITVKTQKNSEVQASVTVTIKPDKELLSDVAVVGDYVAYDAGKWSETKAVPTSSGNFGGYTAGGSKNSTVSCSSNGTKAPFDGWRVLKVDADNETVTLVHAGISECLYVYDVDSAVRSYLETRGSEYINSNYAQSAHMMTKAEAVAITGAETATTNDLRCLGPWYYLDVADHRLYSVRDKGEIYVDHRGVFGTRPVVVLKAGIKTTGMGKDEFNQDAWILTK